jgi:hypothetical protein
MVKRLSGVAIVVASITTLSLHVHAQEPAMKIGPPENMTRVGSIEERYQSYNIEMLEVTGGMFWKPYDQASNDRTGGAIGQQVFVTEANGKLVLPIFPSAIAFKVGLRAQGFALTLNHA